MAEFAEGRTGIRFWITPEASVAVSDAAALRGVERGRYLQNVILHILCEHRPELDATELLPEATVLNARYRGKRDHALGSYGRWSKWTRISCVCDVSLPFILTKIARSTGDISMTSLIRRYLADALEKDLGKRVPMPNGVSGHFAERGMLA